MGVVIGAVVVISAIAFIIWALSLVITGKPSSKVTTKPKVDGSFVLAKAIGSLTDAEYANFKAGDYTTIVARIEEAKGNRTPDEVFLQQQYDAALKGAEECRREIVRYLNKGDNLLADHKQESLKAMEKRAAEIAKKLGLFNE